VLTSNRFSRVCEQVARSLGAAMFGLKLRTQGGQCRRETPTHTHCLASPIRNPENANSLKSPPGANNYLAQVE
jgi:hypothetical protein